MRAVIAINRVDHDLLAEISNALPTTLGNGFNMNRWAAGDGTRIRSPFTRFTRPRFIVSRHPRFIRSAEREIKEVGPQAESSSLLDVDAAVVPGATPGRALDHAFAARPPTFVRHVAPVQVTVSLDGTRDDLSRLLAAVDLAAPMDLDASFCVECRKAPGSVSGGPHGTSAYSCRDVEIAIGSALEGRGYVVDLDRPLQVISVYLEGRTAHLGVSRADRNVFPKGILRTGPSSGESRISRAERKLEEALIAFGISIVPGMKVLDLGAAPGGWTAVLADRGALVTAVDPAALHESVEGHPNVTHIKARAEKLREEGTFDLVTNDMNLEPVDSAKVMLSVASMLRSGGAGIMTIKLPDRRVHLHLKQTTEILEASYEVEEIRHLPHNRQELTAYLLAL